MIETFELVSITEVYTKSPGRQDQSRFEGIAPVKNPRRNYNLRIDTLLYYCTTVESYLKKIVS